MTKDPVDTTTPDIVLNDGTVISHRKCNWDEVAEEIYLRDAPECEVSEDQWIEYCDKLKETMR